jgi:hypothetical protein
MAGIFWVAPHRIHIVQTEKTMDTVNDNLDLNIKKNIVKSWSKVKIILVSSWWSQIFLIVNPIWDDDGSPCVGYTTITHHYMYICISLVNTYNNPYYNI